MWRGFEDIEDPELRCLADRLPEIALSSRRQGTVYNYVNAYNKWKVWSDNFNEINALPADPKFVALYMLNLQESAKSHAPISMCFYALSWVHKMAGLDDPTEHPLPRIVRDAALRTLGKGDNKKRPISAADLRALVVKHDNGNMSLMDLRTITMCLLAYAGFFRYDELSKLRRSDIVFSATYVKIFVEQSKTDIFRDGKWVFIGRTLLSTCPVSMLSRYLKQAKIPVDSDKFIF